MAIFKIPHIQAKGMELSGLRELGLSDGQVKVYGAVLELGKGNLNAIHEKTGIERRNIYDILNKLIEKGLITYIDEDRSRKYRCGHPGKILEEIRKKEEELRKLEREMPNITALMQLQKADIEAQVYRGDESMKTMFNEILEHPESYWLGGNSFEQYSALPKSFFIWFDHWMKRRLEKKHVMYDLVSYGTSLKGLETKKKQKDKLYHYAQLPEGMYIPIVICIYGDKVAQIAWSDKFAFVLQSKKMKEGFMKYFQHFWKLRKEQ